MPRRFDPHPPLSPEGREAITNLVRHGNALIEQRKQLGDPTVQQVQPLGESDIEVLLDAVVNLDCGAPSFAPPMSFAHVGDNLTTAFQGAEHLEPAHLARLFALYGAIRFDPPVRFDWGAVRILEFLHTGPLADCSLSDFAALFEAVGIDPGVFAIAYLDSHWPTLRWDEEGTWRYFSAHLDKLAAALRGRSQWNSIADPQCTVNALHALDCFPRVPPPLLDELWRMALGSAKTHRGRAQTVVQKEPDAFERVLAALSDSRHATRAVAAEWLGRWGLPEAVPALRKALAAEKHDLAIDAQLTALERLGVSIDDVLSPATLTEEAARKLAKMGPPNELSWMPFESLPAVRWRGSAEQIPQQTLTWWLAQAVKLKSPEPGPLLRRQLRLLHPEDRETLGRAILQSWMDYDTMPMTYEQVRQAAERQHAQLRKLHESIPASIGSCRRSRTTSAR
ncbi:MAG: HEAT repeat domain-containing protein [Bryobacterales bacterium]